MNKSSQYSALANPYDAAIDADRHALWQILIARDSEAFAAADWSLCECDFSKERFDGINARGSFDPMNWTLRYPTIESYRDDWLEMARRYRTLPLAGIRHTELLYKMQRIAKAEIHDGRAVVWKQFCANEPLSNGRHYEVCAQSVYRLHRIDGRWRIVGFVGYLPLESTTNEMD
jgi:hypothetical protein